MNYRKIQEVLGLMQKNLECSICLDLLKNPVSTKCDHPFCRFCITEFLKTKKSVPCPLCKNAITKRSLNERPQLSEIVENVRRLMNAMQTDTGQAYSPPKGPQATHFFSCTPERLPYKENRGTKRKISLSDKKELSRGRNTRNSKKRKSMNDVDDTVVSLDFLNNSNNTHTVTKQQNVGQNSEITMGMEHEKNAEKITTSTRTRPGIQMHGEECGPDSKRGKRNSKIENEKRNRKNNSGINVSVVVEKDSNKKLRTGRSKVQVKCSNHTDNLLQYLETGSCGAVGEESSVCSSIELNKNVRTGVLDQERIQSGEHLPDVKGQLRHGERTPICSSVVNINRCLNDFQENGNVNDQLECHNGVLGDEVRETDCNVNHLPDNLDVQSCGGQESLSSTPVHIPVVTRTYSSAHRKAHASKDAKSTFKVKNWLQNIEKMNDNQCADEVESLRVSQEAGNGNIMDNVILGENESAGKEKSASLWEQEVKETKINLGAEKTLTGVTKAEITEPDQMQTKHRIFKCTRNDSHTVTETSTSQKKGKLVFKKIIPKAVIETSETTATDKQITDRRKMESKQNLMIRGNVNNELNLSGQESDPYEFKSSQLTPTVKENNKKRDLHGKSRKLGQISLETQKIKSAKRKNVDAKLKPQESRDCDLTVQHETDVIIVEDESAIGTKNNIQQMKSLGCLVIKTTDKKKMAAKKLSPKLLQLQKESEEFEKMKDSIHEAEDYDLLTSTQEVQEHLTKDQQENPVFDIIPDTLEDTNVVGKCFKNKKSVRFNDEVITIENLSQQGKAELASDKTILGVSDMILQSNCKGRLQIQEGKDKSDSSVSVSGRVDNDNAENKSKKAKSGLISKLNDSRQCQLESQNDGDKFRHSKLSVQEAKQSKGIDDQVDKHGDENLVKQNDVGSMSLLNQDDKSGHHGLMNQEVKIEVSGVHHEKLGFGEEKNQDSKHGNGDFHNKVEKPGKKDLQNLDEEPGCEDLQNQDAESGLQTLQGENDIEHHKSLAQDGTVSFQGNAYQVVSHLPTQDEMVIHESMECDDVMKQTFEGEASISEKHLTASVSFETKGNDVVCEAHVDDETSSTATEDLNVEPREQDFEQVNLDIQPVGILEKLQSQDSERNSMACSNSQTEEQTALSSGPKHHPKQLNKEHSSEVNVCKSNSADENIVLDTPGCENINRVTVKLHKGRTPKKFVEEKIPGKTETLVINDGGHSERNSLTNSCTSTDVTENLEDTIRRKTRKSRRKPNKVCNYSESTQSECDVDNIDNTHRSVVGKQKISTENFNRENLRKTRKPRLKRQKNCSQNEMTEEGSFPDISVVEVVRETQRSQSISIDTDSAQGSVSILAPVQHRVPRHGPLSVNSDMDSTQESVSILKPFSGHHTRHFETSVIHNSTQQHPSDLSIDGKECNVSVTTEGHDNSDKISASFESCSGQVLDICLKKPKRKSFALESSVSATLSESEKTKPCSLGNLQDMKNGHSDLQSLCEVPESANLKENSEIVEENVIDRSATVTSYTQNNEHCEEGSIDELCSMEHKKGQSSSLRSNDRKIVPDSLTWGRNAKSPDLSQELVASECQVGNSEFDTPVVGKTAANTCDSDNAKFCGKVDSVSAVSRDNKINDFGKDDDDDADDDDLTPTLLSVRQLRKKDKNDRSVLCSQEDIFLMDSETPDTYRDEANEIELMQNQEGNMDLEYGLVHSDIESERGSQVSQKQVKEKILASEDIDIDVMTNQIGNSLETDNDVQKCTSFAINKASSKQEVEAKSISQITSDQSCRNQNRKCDVAMILDDCVKSAWCKASNRSSPKRSELSEKLTSATRSGKNLISEETLHVCSVKEESDIAAGSGGKKMHQVSKSGVGGDINVQRDSVHDVMDFQSSVTAHNEPHNNKLSCGSQESNNTENCKAVIHDVKMVDTDSANYQRMTGRASSTKQDSLIGVQTSDRHRITQSPVEEKCTTDIDLLPTSSPLPDVISGYISDNHMSQDDETVPPSAINDVDKSDVEDEDDNDDAVLITRRCPAEMYENVDDSKDEDEKCTPDPQLSLPTENGCQQDIALPRNEVKSLKKENNTDNTDSEDSESSELILSPIINEDERFGDLKDTSEEEEEDIGVCDNNDDLDDSTVVRRKRVRPLIVVDEDEDDNDDELAGRKLNCLRSKAKLIETDDNVEVISVKDTNDECLCLDEEEEDDDEEDYIVRKKKPKSLVIEDEDNSEGDVASQDSSLSHQMNLTSSSAFSSQSEAMSTQHQKKMELDLERMKREIAELEAKISASKKLSDGESFRNKKESKKEDRRKKGKKDKVNGDIVTSRGSDVCKSSNTSESDKSDTDNIEHYESAEESDDLFLSPPPPTPPPFDADISMERHHTVDLPEDIQETDKFLQQFRKGGGKSSLGQAEINADETIEATFQDTSSSSKTNRQSMDLRQKKNIYRDECISNIYSQSETVKKSPLSFLSKPQKIERNDGKNQDENVLSGACETISTIAKPRERSVLSSVVENEIENTVRHIGFVATGLAYLQLRELQKLAQVNTCKVYSKFAYPEVTHIITKTDPTGGRVCDRTLKFFQGVAHGCWILDYQWVLDCRSANRLLPEDNYEITGDTVTGVNHHGPKKSRLCRRKNLFQNVQFYIIGSSKGLSPDDLKGLVLASGGIVVPDPKKFTSDRSSLIVTCSDVDEDEEDNPSSQDVKLFNKLYREYDVLTVSREWVLDSLTLYEVQQLKDYILTCVKGMVIKDIHT